jgi:hypothetical protein
VRADIEAEWKIDQELVLEAGRFIALAPLSV